MTQLQLSANTLERLKDYYRGDDSIILDEVENFQLSRIEAAWVQLRETKNTVQTVAVLRKLYNISVRQAYRDVASARAIFGDIIQYSREAMRSLVNEHAIDLLSRAKESGDLSAESKVLLVLTKVNRLDLDMDEKDIPTLERPVFEVPEEIIAFAKKFIPQGEVNLMELREKNNKDGAS